jgi:hypothetical protein
VPDVTEHGFTFNQFLLTTPVNTATLALMHGASFAGDGAAQLRALADGHAPMAGASLQ